MATETLTDGLADGLPEREAVYWRPLVDERRLRRTSAMWTATTRAHVVPFVAAAAALVAVQPLLVPVSLVSLAHAWVIPELYAHRGANVGGPKPSRAAAGPSACRPGCSPTWSATRRGRCMPRPASCSSA